MVSLIFYLAADVNKTYNLLRNPKTAYIKKRQMMRASFRDYRAKMEKEEKKFKLGKNFTHLRIAFKEKTSIFFEKIDVLSIW